MSKFRIFLGAPLLGDPNNNHRDYRWETISSKRESDTVRDQFPTTPDFPATESLDEASRRISLIYQNAIFNEETEEQDGSFEGPGNESKPTFASEGIMALPIFRSRSDHYDNLAPNPRRTQYR
jgi:hypothetical protein